MSFNIVEPTTFDISKLKLKHVNGVNGVFIKMFYEFPNKSVKKLNIKTDFAPLILDRSFGKFTNGKTVENGRFRLNLDSNCDGALYTMMRDIDTKVEEYITTEVKGKIKNRYNYISLVDRKQLLHVQKLITDSELPTHIKQLCSSLMPTNIKELIEMHTNIDKAITLFKTTETTATILNKCDEVQNILKYLIPNLKEISKKESVIPSKYCEGTRIKFSKHKNGLFNTCVYKYQNATKNNNKPYVSLCMFDLKTFDEFMNRTAHIYPKFMGEYDSRYIMTPSVYFNKSTQSVHNGMTANYVEIKHNKAFIRSVIDSHERTFNDNIVTSVTI